MEGIIREATKNDTDLIFEWANDSEVRKNAINEDAIDYSIHLIWFLDRLRDEKTKIFILEYKNKPSGQIRYELLDGSWVVDYSIDKSVRGIGLGSFLVMKTLKLFSNCTIEATVKKANTASIRVFIKNGFQFKKDFYIGKVEYNIYQIVL